MKRSETSENRGFPRSEIAKRPSSRPIDESYFSYSFKIMTWDVCLENEDREIVDQIALGGEVLSEGENYSCLKYLDKYGDTVFNRLQMEVLEKDVSKLGISAEEKNRIRDLIQKCKNGTHLYIRFSGE